MKVVKRALNLLLLLKHFEEMPLKNIAAALGVPRNSVWNLLNFLCEEGYVEKRGPGRYRLGQAYARFARQERGLPSENMKRIVERVSRNVKETSVAVKLNGAKLKVLDGVNYEREIMVSNKIYDQPDALYCWATGHALLAWQPPLILDGVVKSLGLPAAKQWPGVQSRAKLEEELAKIRESGYAERLNKDCGVHSIAVPALCESSAPVAFGVCYLETRNTAMRRQAIFGSLKQAAGSFLKSL